MCLVQRMIFKEDEMHKMPYTCSNLAGCVIGLGFHNIRCVIPLK
jgi:hypothetical protein